MSGKYYGDIEVIDLTSRDDNISTSDDANSMKVNVGDEEQDDVMEDIKPALRLRPHPHLPGMIIEGDETEDVTEPTGQNEPKALRRVLQKQVLRSQHQPDLDREMERPATPPMPDYNPKLEVFQGWVAWWDNTMGKGQIVEKQTGKELRIAFEDIKHRYGALIPGVYVTFQHEYGNIVDLWVVTGCQYVLFDDAIKDPKTYFYMYHEIDRLRHLMFKDD